MVASKSGELRALFASLDQDADGRISAAELRGCMRATLGEDVPAEEADALVAPADAVGAVRAAAAHEMSRRRGRCGGHGP